MARITLVLWDSTGLRCQDAVMCKIKANLTVESKMEMHNTPVHHLTELLPSNLVSKAVEKLSHMVHDEAVMKTFFREKLKEDLLSSLSKLSHRAQAGLGHLLAGVLSHHLPLPGYLQLGRKLQLRHLPILPAGMGRKEMLTLFHPTLCCKLVALASL